MLRRERHNHWGGGLPGGLGAAFWAGRGCRWCWSWLLPTSVPAATPPQLWGSRGRAPASPWGRGFGDPTGCPWCPQALLETQPQVPLRGPSRASSPFLPVLLHQAGMLALFQSCPLGTAVPCQAGDSALSRGHCHKTPPAPSGGLWPLAPRCNAKYIHPPPQRQQPPSKPQLRCFPQPQKIRLVSQKPQTLKEEGVGGK